MFFKLIILIIIAVILLSLGTGMFYLVRHKDDSESLVKALTWRIGLSVFLFILLLLAFAMGWIKPHGI